MALVRTSVADWLQMRDRLEVAIAEFGRNVPDLSKTVRQECTDFLRWIGDDHFTLQ